MYKLRPSPDSTRPGEAMLDELTEDFARSLSRGECYFIVPRTGTPYQGIYRGFHEGLRCHWFANTVFAAATCGPEWVQADALRDAISLGRPDRNADFEAALESLLS